MNKEIKEKWINALRSGEYKQTKYALHKKSGEMCCIGVLCNIYAKEKNIEWEQNNYDNKFLFKGNETGLQKEINEWAELNEKRLNERDIVINTNEKKSISIMNLNDTENYSFEQIADIIEKEL